MSNIIDYQQKAELIKTARRQLYAEYLSCQKLGYNMWVTEVDVARRASKSLPGSPLLKPFPTEPDVIAKALELYNAISVIDAQPVAAPEVATYLDKIHEVYSTPIVLLDSVLKEEIVTEPVPAAVVEPEAEQPSIGAQLTAAYYGDPLDTGDTAAGEISIADQLSAVYNSRFVEPTMPPVVASPTAIEIIADSAPELDDKLSDAAIELDLAKLAIDEVATEAEPVADTVFEPDRTVESELEVISKPEIVEPDVSNRSTSGIQQLIAKLLKTDQQGKHNV